MGVPVKNIFYLLCYAWDKLEEMGQLNVALDGTEGLPDLFARVLINGTKHILKVGLDSSYHDRTDEILGVKGKLIVSETMKKNGLMRNRTVCEFSEFSYNTLSNQILATTINRLSRTSGLDEELKHELRNIQRKFEYIDLIHITASTFTRVRINRKNRFYGFMMKVCEIVFERLIPSEESGRYMFSDFARDEKKMSSVFEEFLRKFYKIEQQKYDSVGRENISWKLIGSDEHSNGYVPIMQTDVTLQNRDQKIIIDAKYSKETMNNNYGREKVKSNNLYQLFSYLINQEDDSDISKRAIGILLYPTVHNDYDLVYSYSGHDIKIATVNLNAEWSEIHNRLLEIIQ